ncbi:MAG: SDR family NAD(P)-dependent oxidoreductase [Gammaproteobacteria bacterium]|nr:SDR family NAD(P)-dependent oxidoreductase [Gammaproteobacteria bacterium]
MSGAFHGSVALVTGAGRGLGEAIARMLTREGATVICWSGSTKLVRIENMTWEYSAVRAARSDAAERPPGSLDRIRVPSP